MQSQPSTAAGSLAGSRSCTGSAEASRSQATQRTPGGGAARRRGVLERLIGRAGVVPPIDEVTDAYVDLRTWCVRAGHGLGAKDHEADRWVAAVAIAGMLPLATEDSIFDDIPLLHRLDPDAATEDS